MICARGDSGIWAYQEKLLQKFHQRAFAHEISTFLFTVTKVNAVQTRETSQSPSKVFIKPWKWGTGETAPPGNILLRLSALDETSCVTVMSMWGRFMSPTVLGRVSSSWIECTSSGWGFLESRGPAAPVCSTACRFYSCAGCPGLWEVLMESPFSCCTSGNLYQTERI